ncbi:MAG: hypothetical protein AB1941_25515 [Gemmatimonadota bacterium]
MQTQFVGPVRAPEPGRGARRLLAGWILAAALAAPAPLRAQDFTGEYVFAHQGTEVMAIRVDPARGGQVGGQVTAGGNPYPFRGSVAGGKLSFTTTNPDGAVLRWEASRQGDALSVAVSAPGEPAERYTFTRRGAGWSEASPLARQLEQRLTGRSFTFTERTGGGSSGGAVKDTQFSFCPGGRALLEERFVLNVTVPGMGGSETSRRSEPARWRVVAGGGSAGVEFTGRDGEQMQLGIRAGSEPDIVVVAEKPVRLVPAGAKCSDPSLGSLPAARASSAAGATERAAPRGDAGADALAGTYAGQHWLGPVNVQVRREGEVYQVVMNPESASPWRGTGRADAQGGISGEFVTRVLGSESRDTFYLRREGEGFRFRTRGINIVVQRQ